MFPSSCGTDLLTYCLLMSRSRSSTRRRHSGLTMMRMSCVWRCSWLMGSLRPWSKILLMFSIRSVKNRGECYLCDILQINRTLSANTSPGPFCLPIYTRLHHSKNASGPRTCCCGLLVWSSWDNVVYLVLQPLPLQTAHRSAWFFPVGRVTLLMLRFGVIIHLLSTLLGLRWGPRTPDLPLRLDKAITSLSLIRKER